MGLEVEIVEVVEVVDVCDKRRKELCRAASSTTPMFALAGGANVVGAGGANVVGAVGAVGNRVE